MITLKPHQEKAVADFWARDGKAYLYGEGGVGKTFTALEVIKQLIDRELVARPSYVPKVLILVPASQHEQWTNKISEYFAGAGLNYGYYTFIFHIEQLGTKDFEPVDRTMWDLIVVDEAHRVNNPTGVRTKALHRLRSTYKLLMSGTPHPNGEWEWYANIQFLSPGLLGRNWYAFLATQCTINFFGTVDGLRDADEFRTTIAPFIIRVEGDVLDLKPVISTTVHIAVSPAYLAEYERMRKECRVTLNGRKIMIKDVRAMIGRCRQFVDCPRIYATPEIKWPAPKLPALRQYLDKPCLIFVEYKEAIDEIKEILMGRRYAVIAGGSKKEGGVSMKERERIKQAFQDGEIDIIIGTAAMAEGGNWQRAERIIHYSYPYTQDRVRQRTWRAQRMGQDKQVEEIFLLVDKTVDEMMAKMVERKGKVGERYTLKELLSLLD